MQHVPLAVAHLSFAQQEPAAAKDNPALSKSVAINKEIRDFFMCTSF